MTGPQGPGDPRRLAWRHTLPAVPRFENEQSPTTWHNGDIHFRLDESRRASLADEDVRIVLVTCAWG
jgi:hypothetical protein